MGENPLFPCARNGNCKIFMWFAGHNEFFKARGTQNYKGQTIEHIVCLNKRAAIVDEIRPRPDTPDYMGNLPLFYTIAEDDVEMISKYFTKTRDYFGLRNYKYETIFHIAARHNSLAALKELLGRHWFLPYMMRKDHEGNTALHVAAKRGNHEMLEWLLSSVTSAFTEIQNDFGFTPEESAIEKARHMEKELVKIREPEERGAFEAKIRGVK